MADLDDYSAHYAYDLAGNRTKKTVDTGSDGSTDEIIGYTYDANDRLRSETRDTNADGTTDETVAYTYDATEQTGQTVSDANGTITQQTTNTYNLQGRLAQVVTESYDASGNVIERTTSTFEYDASGIRTQATYKVEIDDDNDPATPLTVQTQTTTTYLNDPQNPTGYSQVLEEITKDGAGEPRQDENLHPRFGRPHPNNHHARRGKRRRNAHPPLRRPRSPAA